MIMMMTDSDRVAFARISACICVLFHSPLHAVVNAHLPPECPSCNLSHHITPILVFHSHQLSSFHFTSTFRPSQTRHHLSRLLPSSSSFHSTSQPVLFHFYLFAANDNQKLAIKITSSPPLILCKPARAHAPFCVRISMYLLPLVVFISHQKEGFVREGRRQSPPKKPFVVSKYFIVVPVQEQFIKFVKNAFFFGCKKSHLKAAGLPLFLLFTSHNPLFVIHIVTPQMTADAPQ
jgi:hypothetical protein